MFIIISSMGKPIMRLIISINNSRLINISNNFFFSNITFDLIINILSFFFKEYEPSVVNIIIINNKSILIIIAVFLLKEGCLMIYFLFNLLFNTLLDFTIVLSCVNYVMINIFYIIFGNNIRKCCHSILTVNSIVNNFIK